MPFRHTINPYRGCSHACVYCFARPTHDYLGLGIGTDFERKIVVKVNAVERLRAELRSPKWGGDHIAMGTNTDPYQHAEGKYHLTRGIVETLSGARNPFSILTKSTLILRDAALLAAASRAHRRGGELLHRDARPRRVVADRAGHAPAGPAGRGAAAPDRPRDPLRGPGGAGAARALRLRGPAARGRRGLRGRPARSPSTAWRCTCGAPCAPTTSTGSKAARPDLVRLHRARFRRGAYQEDEERERVEGIVRAAARRCGRDRARPLPRHEGTDDRRRPRTATATSTDALHGTEGRAQQLRLLWRMRRRAPEGARPRWSSL